MVKLQAWVNEESIKSGPKVRGACSMRCGKEMEKLFMRFRRKWEKNGRI